MEVLNQKGPSAFWGIVLLPWPVITAGYFHLSRFCALCSLGIGKRCALRGRANDKQRRVTLVVMTPNGTRAKAAPPLRRPGCVQDAGLAWGWRSEVEVPISVLRERETLFYDGQFAFRAIHSQHDDNSRVIVSKGFFFLSRSHQV